MPELRCACAGNERHDRTPGRCGCRDTAPFKGLNNVGENSIRKGEWQRWYRRSDNSIVLMSAGNAAGGKGVACGDIFGETYPILRD